MTLIRHYKSESGFSLLSALVGSAILILASMGGLALYTQVTSLLGKAEHKHMVASIRSPMLAQLFKRVASLSEQLGGGLTLDTDRDELIAKLGVPIEEDKLLISVYLPPSVGNDLPGIPDAALNRCRTQSFESSTTLATAQGLYLCFTVQNALTGSCEATPGVDCFLEKNFVMVETRAFLSGFQSFFISGMDFSSYVDGIANLRQIRFYYAIHWSNKTNSSLVNVATGVLRGESRGL